jgi:hypothetical protein
MRGGTAAMRPQSDLAAKGFDVWLAKQRTEGGASWTVEIEKANRLYARLAARSRGSRETSSEPSTRCASTSSLPLAQPLILI